MIPVQNCHYCGCTLTTKTLTRDHLRPRSRGGSNKLRNKVPACGVCNSIKGNRTIDDARRNLIQYKIGWPKFSQDQLNWLRARGFCMEDFDNAKLRFEEVKRSPRIR